MASRADTVRAVQRAMKDEELQHHVRNAYKAAKNLHGAVGGGRKIDKLAGLAQDKHAQKQLRVLVEEVRAGADRLGNAPHARRRTGRKLMLLALVAVGVAVVRKRLMSSAASLNAGGSSHGSPWNRDSSPTANGG